MLHKTVAEVRRISSLELEGWRAYLSEVPPADERADMYSAQTAAIVAASHGAKCSMTDFVLKFRAEQPEPQSDDVQARNARMLTDG